MIIIANVIGQRPLSLILLIFQYAFTKSSKFKTSENNKEKNDFQTLIRT